MAEAAIAAAQAVAAWLAQEGVKQAIVKAVISAAVSVGVSKLAAAENKARPQGTLITLDLAGDAPRRVQIGQRGNGGVMADWYSRGDKNQWVYIPIYLSEGPCGALTGMWSNGRRVFDGTLNHGQRVQLTDFDSPDGRAWLTYYDGRPGQTADPTLVGHNLGWTNQCVGEGLAYVIVEFRWDPDTVPVIPQTFFETQGAKFYDRRLDSTAGGSGSHRLKDPDTWELSTNPAVVLDHYKLGRFLSDADTEPVFGIGLPEEECWTYAEFAAMANICDETVTSYYGGVQTRYEANGFQFSDSKHKDNILDLGRAMNARPGDIGGRLVMLHGEARTPVLVLTDGDRIDGSQEQYSPKKSVNDLVQRVTGTYQDPNNNYMPTNYPEVGEAAWISEDGGEVDPTQLDLEMEIDSERAQRVATAYARRKRRQATLTSVFGLKALELEDGDWFIRQGARFSTGKTFEVNGSPRLNPDALTVTLNALEVDASDSAWDEQGVVEIDPSSPATGDGIRLPLPSVSISPISYVLGTVGLPIVIFSNNDFDDGNPTAIEIEIAEDDGSGGPDGTRLTLTIPLGVEASSKTGLAPGIDYVARYRAALGDRTSLWSTWESFTTTSSYVVPGSGVSNWAELTGRPTELTDGRVAAGLDSNGFIAANIPLNIANSSDLLRFTSGGLFSGDLTADITAENTALDFVGRGALATLNNVNWNTLITNRPGELTDGRVSAGLTSTGDLNRNITTSRLNSSNVLRYTAGGLFSGDLAADITGENTALDFVGRGALATLNNVNWNTLITNRPGELTDGRVSAGLTSTGDLNRNITTSRLNSSNVLRYTAGGLFSGDLTADITGENTALDFVGRGALATLNNVNWNTLITNRPGELTDGRVSAGLTSTGDLNRNITTSRLNSSNVLRYTAGGLFSGDLTADITGENTALDFVGRGALATLNNVNWNTLITNRPTELTDGRITAGLNSAGNLNRDILVSRLNSSNVLRRSAGGLFTGDLSADVTGLNTALDFVGRGALATANESSRRRYAAIGGILIKSTWTSVASVTITTDGGITELEWDFEAYYDFTTGGSVQGPNRIMVRIARGGVDISGERTHCTIEGFSPSFSGNTMKFSDLSSPGSVASPVSTTYQLQAYQTDDSGLGTVPSDLAGIRVRSAKNPYIKASNYPLDANDVV